MNDDQSKAWESPEAPESELHQVTTDGRNVWVNSPEVCLARFGPGLMDVHCNAKLQMERGHVCEHCRPLERDYQDWKEGWEVWQEFRAKVQELHGINIDPAFWPEFCRGPLYDETRIGWFRAKTWARRLALANGRAKLREMVEMYEAGTDERSFNKVLAVFGRWWLTTQSYERCIHPDCNVPSSNDKGSCGNHESDKPHE